MNAQRFWTVAVSVCLATAAQGQSKPFEPIGNFDFHVGGGAVSPSASSSGDVNSWLAQRMIAGYLLNNARAGVAGTHYVDERFFTPIRASLSGLKDAQQRSDSAAAQAAAGQALATLNQFKAEKHPQIIFTLLAHTGNNREVGEYANRFFAYVQNLEHTVNEAQAVPAQIGAYIRSNAAGERLFLAATHHAGAAYGPGMHCNELIEAASRDAGVAIAMPDGSGTVTERWFAHGLGGEYRQILGGDSGVELGQLADDEGSGKVNIPIGAVIVAEGHAALFDGVAKVQDGWELILYDANDQDGYTLSLGGVAVPHDDPNAMLTLPGHQVGEHLTWLQWRDDHLVKVFQPLGNHPSTVANP